MTPDVENLTERQFEVLCHIREYIQDNGYPPTVRELGEMIGTTSPSTVHEHLRALRDKGFIHVEPGRFRALRVIA